MIRRKNKKIHVMKRETVTVDQFAKSGRICAWDGCANYTKGEADLPPDWTNLVVWWSPQPEPEATIMDVVCSTTCLRDAALCGVHTRELESLLKPLGRELDHTVGEA